MKQYRYFLSRAFACGFIALVATPAFAINVPSASGFAPLQSLASPVGELLATPPPYPEGMEPPKLDRNGMLSLAEGHLREKFDQHANASHELTLDGVKNTGWGFVADHFGQIDTDGDGVIRYGEYANFMEARSPVKRKSGLSNLQIVK